LWGTADSGRKARVSRIVRASDQALLVVFDDAISRAASAAVRSLFAWLRDEPCAGVVDLHPAYGSLLVRFDALRHESADIERELARRLGSLAQRPAPLARSYTIPVRYGGDDGCDLERVAEALGLTPSEVVRVHAGAAYEVAFVGFSPGFAYLLGLPERLAVPRRPTPRSSVPAGSVAIAGRQAGIYPLATPGGWQLIGRTDVRLFDAARPGAALLAPGDLVRFVAAAGEPA
jgi:inhibitor of KinA